MTYDTGTLLYMHMLHTLMSQKTEAEIKIGSKIELKLKIKHKSIK